MKKAICGVLLVCMMAVCLAGCEYEKSKENIQIQAAQAAAGGIVENQPVPMLEREKDEQQKLAI